MKTKQSAEREFRVPSGSMEPTLGIGARVLVSTRAPRVGEIVVFHPPEVAEQQKCGPKAHVIRPGGAACAQAGAGPSGVKFVKRIVAGAGDELFIREGHVYRKAAGSSAFVRESDRYIRPCANSSECNFPTPIKVSAGQWYMLGDNRGESDDSRFYGAIPATWIVGAVTACAPLAAYRSGIDRLEGSRTCRLGAERG
ncbi:MAG TPA: signal peptidase I [Solirubrobacteraceae bacterium]|nr:signal peptidase I [Solirubrobacteraceae bacterium]